MRVIDCGEKLLAVGLDWEHSHLGVFSKAEVRKLAAAHRATHYVEHKSAAGGAGQEHAYGFCKLPKLPRGDRKRDLLSLASVVAAPRSDAFIFVAPLENNEAAFIGVLSGQPAAGCDFVGSEEEVAEAATRFSETNGVLQVYYSEALGRPDFLAGKGFEFKETQLYTEQSEDLKLLRVGGVSNLVVLALVLMLLGGGTIGMLAFKKAQEEAAMAARTPAVSPQLAYEMSRDEAMRGFSSLPLSAAFQPLNSLLQNLQTQSGGWDATKTQCSWSSGSTPPIFNCVTKWTNRAGNFRSFVAQRGHADVDYDDGLALLSTRSQLKFDGAVLIGPEQVEALPKFADYKLDTGSLLQDFSQIDFKVGTTAPVLLGATSDQTVKNQVLRLGWSLEGPSDLAELLIPALPPNMTIDEIELTIPDSRSVGKPDSLPRIKFSGGVYVRK